jgi:hypothetical protein
VDDDAIVSHGFQVLAFTGCPCAVGPETLREIGPAARECAIERRDSLRSARIEIDAVRDEYAKHLVQTVNSGCR